MKIGNKEIGNGRTYFIAEFGVNHNGSLERAFEGIRAAALAGADAIKFQTYTADELVVKGTPKFWAYEGDKDKDQHQAYAAIGGFPLEWYPKLIECCKENNIEFLSTPFSFEAADYLNSLGMAAFKVASSDLSTLPYLEHIAKFGKPILLSTGAATLEEVIEAVETIERAGNDQIVVMQCTLSYPTKNEDANLDIIRRYAVEFPQYEVGLSDHTLVTLTPVIAAAMGAAVIEKHFTVDKTLGESADHWLSIDPPELKAIVEHLRAVEVMRGSFSKTILPCEAETRKYDKRSIVSKTNISKDSVIIMDNLTFKRPGTGIWPKDLSKVLGSIAKDDIEADTTLTWELIQTTE